MCLVEKLVWRIFFKIIVGENSSIFHAVDECIILVFPLWQMKMIVWIDFTKYSSTEREVFDFSKCVPISSHFEFATIQNKHITTTEMKYYDVESSDFNGWIFI